MMMPREVDESRASPKNKEKKLKRGEQEPDEVET